MGLREQIIKYVQDNNLTLAQLNNVSKAQLDGQFGVHGVIHYKNVLRSIKQGLKAKEDKTKLLEFKSHALPWLRANGFPDADMEWSPRTRKIITHLDGIPEILE
jgi:hypothetical protein